MFKFYDNQIETSKQILKCFENVFWVVLQALMQSGKTGTYLLTVFEIMKNNSKKNVYILCGSSSLKLKEQLIKDFEDGLDYYIDKLGEEGVDFEKRRTLKNKIKKNTKICFSNDLKKINNVPDDTLIIWDESHYAQNKENRPNKLFERLQIEATGNKEYLKHRNISVLSVSATGFSEFSDIYHLEQDKEIVRMINDDKYIGVKEFYENGNIISFDNCVEKLDEILFNNLHENKYSIIRCTKKNCDQIKEKFEEYDWNVKIFNSDVQEIDSLNCLKEKPEKNTAILIKGMCRMGEQLCKNHVSFVMETSKNPKTDVILQGLLGRMCGYDSNLDIIIYLNENILKNDKNMKINEIEKFIKFYEGENIMPCKANNLIKSENIWKHNIISKISCEYIENVNDRTKLINSIEDAVTTGNIENFNDESSHIEERILNTIKFDDSEHTKIEIRNIDGRNENGALSKTYKRVPFQIMKSYNEKTEALLTDSGCTFTSSSKEIDIINIWVFKTDKFSDIGIEKNDVFIDTRTLNDENINITTKKECFSNKLKHEDGTIVNMNGVHSNFLPIETSTNEKLMEEKLLECIKLSLDKTYPSYNTKYITSSKSDDDKWIGIFVSSEIYISLQKNGRIYNNIYNLHKFKIKTHKTQGKQKIYEDGKIRLTKISW